jgi:hypothetical protein
MPIYRNDSSVTMKVGDIVILPNESKEVDQYVADDNLTFVSHSTSNLISKLSDDRKVLNWEAGGASDSVTIDNEELQSIMGMWMYSVEIQPISGVTNSFDLTIRGDSNYAIYSSTTLLSGENTLEVGINYAVSEPFTITTANAGASSVIAIVVTFTN